MKINNHLTHAGNAAWQTADQVVLVAIVDAHVRVSRRYQHRVDAAIPLLESAETGVHRIASGHRIIEVAVVHPHLWLHEAAPRPFDCGNVIARRVVADANEACGAPIRNIGEPLLVPPASARLRSSLPSSSHDQTIGSAD